MPVRNERYAGPANPHVFDAPGGKEIQHLLWGDWLKLKRGRQGGWREVHARGCDGWMKEEDIQKDRLLEIVFVDVGQGDGCLVVTPDDEHLVIDAGVDDNMYRFLNWRYGGFKEPWRFKAGIISHPDSDHYRGFTDLFAVPNVTFDVLYHNGIMERRGGDSLGRRLLINGRSCLVELCDDKAALKDFLSVKKNWKHPNRSQYDKQYPTMLAYGLENGSFAQFTRLSRNTHTHLPGWGPGAKIELEVLAPVLETAGNTSGLRWLGGVSYTKNGHSIVIKLRFGDVTILLGGDLNVPSQELLLEHYTGLDPRPDSRDEHDVLIRSARKWFEVDIAKACHHGSADVSTRFMEATNPIATIISSGDDEPHAHPRADALGAAGRHGRGNRPLIFSTELARSTRDTIRRPEVMKQRLEELWAEGVRAPEGSALRRRLAREFNELKERIDRSVAVYGAIHLRTDGRHVVLAHKLERPRGKKKWDIYSLVNRGGVLQYESKYD